MNVEWCREDGRIFLLCKAPGPIRFCCGYTAWAEKSIRAACPDWGQEVFCKDVPCCDLYHIPLVPSDYIGGADEVNQVTRAYARENHYEEDESYAGT
ncbi:hypothetical protein DSM19430T_21130 [Desulfovibrio psychrotolerans]|uniref:Uncharacterized protein n=1 Tax=Desulfovibrio psychrotolerans TaxID=415242 RepID=A0A7J0BUP4_9BACT|nr:hypothetical protein DSM19430T_21130 [Desulfovibrio psychrotolerans]